MSDKNTPLSTFTDDSSIRRTVNEYATSYEVSVPEDVFDITSFSGYIQYDIVVDNGVPRLHVRPNPDSTDFGENVLLVTGETELPLPSGILEPCAPESLTEWTREDNGFSARLDIPAVDDVSGDRLATGMQTVEVDGDTGVLTLPKHPAVKDAPACSFQVFTGSDGLEIGITLRDPEADATVIHEPTTLPYINLPVSFVQALHTDRIEVTVFESGPQNTRLTLLEKYPSEYGRTSHEDIEVAETTRISLPDYAVSAAKDGGAMVGRIRTVAKQGGLLLICDGNQTDDHTEYEIQDETLQFSSSMGDWLELTESDIYWHFYDGCLIGETVAKRPATTQNTHGHIGEFVDEGLQLPTAAFEQAGIASQSELTILATAESDTVGLTVASDRGVSVDSDWGDNEVTLHIPQSVNEALSRDAEDVLLCRPTDDELLICVPMAETQANKHVGAVDASEVSGNSRLYIPEDGRNAFVQQVGEGDSAVGIPTDAIERFDLEKGSRFKLTVGTYEGALALYCEPIEDDEVTPDVCLGRMLSSSNLRLPVQLVSTLSLFERSITWGLLWNPEGEQLVGVLEEVETPSVSAGSDVGSGQVYTTVKDRDGNQAETTHYSVTIPKSAFDVFTEHPPGVFIGCESFDGIVRIVLTPVGESDLDIIGAVKLRDNWDDEYYEFTLPKSLASALSCENEDLASWTFLDGRFVGTLESSQR